MVSIELTQKSDYNKDLFMNIFTTGCVSIELTQKSDYNFNLVLEAHKKLSGINRAYSKI